MFDAHLHLQDRRIIPYHAQFVKDALEAGVTECISCASNYAEWFTEVSCSLKVHQAYGLHPWFCEVAPPDWEDALYQRLTANPTAMIGEIGLDGIRKTADNGLKQRQALIAQLELATHLHRPIILHGTRAWQPLIEILKSYVDKLPALLFHGVGFSTQLFDQPFFRRPNLWFSFGGSLLYPNAVHLPVLAKIIPEDRLLVETDSPDMFPIGGEPCVLGQYHALYNQPGNLRLILQKLADLRAIPIDQLVSITEINAHNLLKDL